MRVTKKFTKSGYYCTRLQIRKMRKIQMMQRKVMKIQMIQTKVMKVMTTKVKLKKRDTFVAYCANILMQ